MFEGAKTTPMKEKNEKHYKNNAIEKNNKIYNEEIKDNSSEKKKINKSDNLVKEETNKNKSLGMKRAFKVKLTLENGGVIDSTKLRRSVSYTNKILYGLKKEKDIQTSPDVEHKSSQTGRKKEAQYLLL